MIHDSAKRGVSALVIVLVMTAIVLEVTVASLVVTRLLGNNMADEQASLEALELAKGGAEDAIIRVSHYINCPNSTYCPGIYAFTVGSGNVCVNIVETVANQEITIYSRGTIQDKQKFVQAVLGVMPSDASVEVKMLKEIENPGDEFSDIGC
ncbi:MAG: hypothetical protein PHV43_02130 [Candidatus Colwellbacteria bacterium]|nr:hypothetical protein [Candidatus Colwellbacteria bacterium]